MSDSEVRKVMESLEGSLAGDEAIRTQASTTLMGVRKSSRRREMRRVEEERRMTERRGRQRRGKNWRHFFQVGLSSFRGGEREQNRVSEER